MWRQLHLLNIDMTLGIRTIQSEGPCKWKIGNGELLDFKLKRTTYLTKLGYNKMGYKKESFIREEI